MVVALLSVPGRHSLRTSERKAEVTGTSVYEMSLISTSLDDALDDMRQCATSMPGESTCLSGS